MPIKAMPFVMGSRVDSFSTAGAHLLDLYGPDQLPDPRVGVVGEYAVWARARVVATIPSGAQVSLALVSFAGDVMDTGDVSLPGSGQFERVFFGATGPVGDVDPVDPQGFRLRVTISGSGVSAEVQGWLLAVSTPFPPLYGLTWQNA